MSNNYPMAKIAKWKDGIPFDEFNHALDPTCIINNDMRPAKGEGDATMGMTLTNPYGILQFGVGDSDYFFVFDYGMLPGGKIVLHSVINSETGSFIDTASYIIVSMDEAEDAAQKILDSAMDALIENGVRNKGWRHSGQQFVTQVKSCVQMYRRHEKDDLRQKAREAKNQPLVLPVREKHPRGLGGPHRISTRNRRLW